MAEVIAETTSETLNLMNLIVRREYRDKELTPINLDSTIFSLTLETNGERVADGFGAEGVLRKRREVIVFELEGSKKGRRAVWLMPVGKEKTEKMFCWSRKSRENLVG